MRIRAHQHKLVEGSIIWWQGSKKFWPGVIMRVDYLGRFHIRGYYRGSECEAVRTVVYDEPPPHVAREVLLA